MRLSLSAIMMATFLISGYGLAGATPVNAAQPYSISDISLRETRDSLREGFLLLGESDSDAASAFHGGRSNYAVDGTTLIGRIYDISLFGGIMQAGTLYDQAGKVSTVSALELTRKPEVPDSDSADWLPPHISRQFAEKDPLPALEKAVVAYYGIPEKDRARTCYVYNKVDLNGDGTQEILAVISGPYTSGTGGSSAVWGRMVNGTFQIYQTFTLIRTPVIITAEAVNGRPYGARGIIVRRSGGGMTPELIRYVSHDGEYLPEPFTGLDKIKGTAVLCTAPGTHPQKITLTHY